MYNIIPLIIILLCLAGISAIVLKKLPLLTIFDVNEIPEEKAAQTKNKIIEERLERKVKHFSSKLQPFFQILSNFFQRKVSAVKTKIQEVEDKYKNQTKKEILVTKSEFLDLEKKIEDLLDEGKSLMKNENFEEAEKKIIEVLALDPKNLKAYHELGDLYYLQKQFVEAEATFKHILKINKTDDQAYFKLAEVYEKMEKPESVVENLVKALELVPNSPKYLDLLLTNSIILKNKELAVETLEKLKSVNPENAKIAEFEQQLKEI
ncbi:MAG: tetratricopeptide repeat protein [Candidatus Parcubacteria bacterium]|nr:tetratricopeptide repeat protein [Candidatus Parcubacteria bacterium]